MNETTMILPEWIASQVAAAGLGGADLQSLMDEGPFRPPSVRTVAESGDFEIVAGRVHRRTAFADGEKTWLPAEDPRVEVDKDRYLVPFVVTEDLLAGRGMAIPRSIAGMLEVPRWYHRTLDSRLGKRAVQLSGTEARIGPVTDFLTDLGLRVGEHGVLVFDRNGHLDVRRWKIE